jgi:hypothetical protein
MYRLQVRMTVLAVLTLMALAVVPAVHAQPVHAQARTWVSGVGNDANPCSRIAPCKTFAGAISKTTAGGEISVLDPGDFGPVTIDKSITINGDGTLASILALNTTGIVVNVGRFDNVIIRNVSINGAGTGIDGVRYRFGGRLTLENVTINGFRQSFGDAVDASLVPNSTAPRGELLMNNVTITNCANGVRLEATPDPFQATLVQATLDNVRIQASGSAVMALSNAQVTIKHSNLSHNNSGAVFTGAATAVINVEDSVLAHNNTGVFAAAGRIRISDNAIVNNFVGIHIEAGAFVESAGNNRIDGNSGTGAGSPPNDIYDVE